MSMLAEPRRRQRLSVDPRNLQWKNDEGAFGRKMLSKMGWIPGKGLGKKEQGSEENVKVNANYTRKGLGSRVNYDDTWVAHHDDFAMLLANLNGKKLVNGEEICEEQAESLEAKSKLSRSRMHYKNAIRSKDLSQYSEQDKAAVLGSFKTTGSKPPKRKLSDDDSLNKFVSSSDENDTSLVRSGLSMKEYFAEKLKRFKGVDTVKMSSKGEKHNES